MDYKGKGISFLGALQILFIALKLIGIINWEWVVVLIPLWLEMFFILVVLMTILSIKIWQGR